MRANLILLWVAGFLGLGTLSAGGASSLFPLPLAILIALIVTGLGSAAAFQFRAKGNVLLLLGGIAMIACASFLDGVSVWEILNNRQNSALHATTAALESATKVKDEAELRTSKVREEIGTLVQEAQDMDHDGDSANDRLIPGVLAKVKSRKADLANFEAQATEARRALALLRDSRNRVGPAGMEFRNR